MDSSKDKIRILLVEDDVNLGFLLVDFLESDGFEVKLCRDGESGYKGFQTSGFDLCIVDLMLPRMDGFTLAGKIKETDPEIPIIILSARSMKEDKIKGFRMGIDDYITKPFDEEELLYRVKAILSRTRQSNFNQVKKTIFQAGKYEFDPANQLLTYKGKQQRLTIKESRILGYLCNSINNLVKREEIMIAVWGDSDYYTGRSLDVFISKLRGYLRDDSAVRITTIPTVGYILEVEK
ncbi:MAG: DNA-binding response regulator [Odoribacter sp.]|nr:DNA-binding response regulator [Odoribacter sp.]